mgnify:CR=1 FL=1
MMKNGTGSSVLEKSEQTTFGTRIFVCSRITPYQYTSLCIMPRS